MVLDRSKNISEGKSWFWHTSTCNLCNRKQTSTCRLSQELNEHTWSSSFASNTISISACGMSWSSSKTRDCWSALDGFPSFDSLGLTLPPSMWSRAPSTSSKSSLLHFSTILTPSVSVSVNPDPADLSRSDAPGILSIWLGSSTSLRIWKFECAS